MPDPIKYIVATECDVYPENDHHYIAKQGSNGPIDLTEAEMDAVVRRLNDCRRLEIELEMHKVEHAGCWLAEDRMPTGACRFVDVCGSTHSAAYDSNHWVMLHIDKLKPWHIWRWRDKPCDATLVKSSEVRNRLWAVPEGNLGHYFVKDDK